MSDLRIAAQQALAFTMRDFASLRDFEAAKAVLHDNLRAALAQQDEPVLVQGELPPRYVARSPIHAEPVEPVEPVAWVGDPSTQDYASTQPEPDAYGYASRLAFAIWEKHYKDTAPQWKPFDDLMGVLTQIDNMTSGLTRLAQQDEPAQQTRKDGRYSVAYRCKCGHEQNVTEIMHGGRTYAGSGANWCDGCGDGPPVRVDAMQQQAEPVQEPVAWIYQNMYTEQEYLVWKKGTGGRNWRPLYTAPPQRKPLTEEVAALTAQRDALLEALKGLVAWADDLRRDDPVEDLRKARAAIKAVEETK